ncbi:MAG TPA: hypothetical protein DEP28_03125 [Bacteroidetes bacterium]|nr:hypothetical protein [Bacteroidota bacterium]HCN36768.1 hypothetical protein [Bacteroidota bacterium]
MQGQYLIHLKNKILETGNNSNTTLDFKLVAVKCKNCDSGLVVEVNDNITYCTSCGSGFEIIDGELIPIEINFASPAMRGNGEPVYRPFWLLKTTVTILERNASGNFFKNLFGSNNPTGSGSVMFYIPAFYCSLDNMKVLAQEFTMKNPVASPQKFNTKLVGFAYGKEDAKKLAEFVLISMEAEKSDMMKTFKYNIDFHSLEIIGIPFYKISENRYKDAILGIEI